MPQSRTTWSLLIGVVLLVTLLVIGVIPRVRQNAELVVAATAPDAGRVPVSVVVPRPADGPVDLVLPSNIQAIEETAIYARTTGYVRERTSTSAIAWSRERSWPRSTRRNSTRSSARPAPPWPRPGRAWPRPRRMSRRPRPPCSRPARAWIRRRRTRGSPRPPRTASSDSSARTWSRTRMRTRSATPWRPPARPRRQHGPTSTRCWRT